MDLPRANCAFYGGMTSMDEGREVCCLQAHVI